MRIRRLRDKLILASLFVSIPLIIWNTAVQVARYRENRLGVILSQQEVARDIAVAYADHTRDLVALQQSIGYAVLARRVIEPEFLPEYLTDVSQMARSIRHLAIADPQGSIFASSTPHAIGYNIFTQPDAGRLRTGDPWVVTDVFTLKGLDKPVFAIETGITDQHGRLLGVVAAFIDEDTLSLSLGYGLTHGISGREQIVITDNRGVVVLAEEGFQVDHRGRDWSGVPFIKGGLDGRSVVVDGYETPGGQVMLGVTEPVQPMGWTVTVFAVRDQVLGPVRRLAAGRIAVVLVVAVLAIGLAVYLGSRMAKPVIHLADRARALGSGDLGARADVKTGDEIEILARSFNEMADSLQLHTEQLHAAFAAESREKQTASALYMVAQGLIVNNRLDDRLEVISQALASMCRVERCVVLLRRGDRLAAVTGWGLRDPQKFPELVVDMAQTANEVDDALLSGQPILVGDAETDPRADPEISDRYDIKGFLALPLVRREHLVGVAVLDTPGKPPSFDQETIDTARGLAGLAAIAIENSETVEKWCKIAEAFQRAMLPDVPASRGDLTIATKYVAALEMAELGGDFYDFIPLPDGRLGLAIGDVSGKGLEAAVYTAMGKYTIRAFLAEDPDPGSVLTRANKALACAGGEWGFVTVFYGVLDPETGVFDYANAGHPPPLLVKDSGEIVSLHERDLHPPIGIFGDLEYTTSRAQIDKGDLLACYTDGVTEARHNGDMFDPERLAQTLSGIRNGHADEIADAVHEAVVDFSRGRIQDDIALLVVKRQGV